MLIVVGTTMIFGFPVFLKSRRKSLDTDNSKQFAAAPPYRSLFEPDEEEMRQANRENKAEALTNEAEQARRAAKEKAEAAESQLQKWRVSPDKSQTVELLKIASEINDAEKFSEIAENVIQVWRKNRINNLNAADLADLLDSHLKILPQQERTSGALFWLKREIKNLREKSEEIK